MEFPLPGGWADQRKGTLTGEALLPGFSNVNVAWMRFAWTFGTFATVMLTRMNGNVIMTFLQVWGNYFNSCLIFSPREKDIDEKFNINLDFLMTVIVFNFENYLF